MKILVAPDKFKGSLTATEVCDAIAQALWAIDPSLQIAKVPLADGGEGTCELLTTQRKGVFQRIEVDDPLSRKISTQYGLSSDGKIAFLEMAKASGLQLLRDEERNPWYTSTAGTGQMIRHALDMGVETIMMGIGGSATNDGGMGMAQALGINFFDIDKKALAGSGSVTGRVHSIDSTNVHPRLQQVKFIVFCDVDNPLTGPTGAAAVFSPQKGADAEMVKQLDDGLKHFGDQLQKHTGRIVNFPGAGAGGGLPASLKAFANIEIRPGMEFIIEFIGLEQQVAAADIVFTGEGKLDQQTLAGKVVKGISDLTSKHGKKLVVVAGKSELGEHDLKSLGIAHLLTLSETESTDAHAIANAFELVQARVTANWPALASG